MFYIVDIIPPRVPNAIMQCGKRVTINGRPGTVTYVGRTFIVVDGGDN